MTPEIKKRIEQIRRGEVPEGYKQTGSGTIPSEWHVTALGTLLGNIESGTSVNSDVSNTTGLYVLKTSAIQHGKVDLEESKAVVRAEIQRLKCPVKSDCLLISRMNTPLLVGACGYVEKSSKHHFLPDRLWQAHNIDSDHCNLVYLNFLLNTDRYKVAVQSLATGTSNSMKNISQESYLGLILSLPHLREQQKMAAILTTQDKVIELKEKLLAEKQRQKKYLCQQLLTGKKRLPGFSAERKITELGAIAKKKIAKNTGFLSSLVLSNSAQHGIVPQDQQFDKEIANAERIDGYYVVDPKDFVYNPRISVTAPCGPINMNETGKTGVMSPLYLVFSVCNNEVNLEYLKQYFKSTSWFRHMKSVANYGARHDRMSIADDDFFAMPIPMPDLGEQSAIAEILSAADQEIGLLQKSIDAETQKKKALMQLLLTGIVRVKA